MSQPLVYREPLDGTEQFRVLKDGRFYVAPISAILALVAPQVAGLAARVAAIESGPEEAAHFTASARLPAITVGQTVTLTLTSLVPAVAGDRIRKGDVVLVQPVGALPPGLNIAAAYVLADDTVSMQLTTGLAISASSSAVAWAITALR